MDDLTTAAITAGRAEQPSGARAGWAAAHIFSSLTGGDYESDGDLKTYASVFVRDFEAPTPCSARTLRGARGTGQYPIH